MQIGAVMRGASIGKVLASKSAKLAAGDYVNCSPGWTELAILPASQVTKIYVPANGKVTDALGVLYVSTFAPLFIKGLRN